MKLEKLKVLSDDDINTIHQASLDILANCGVKILHPKMLEFLKSKGLEVDFDKQIVKFTTTCIEEAISSAPHQFEVYNQKGKGVFVLGDGMPKIAAGHNAVFWVDSETGQTRPSKTADVALFARICEELNGIDMIGIPVMPQDVPKPQISLLYGVQAVIENSIKPLYFSTDNAKINNACIRMLATVFEGDLGQQAYAISQLSPTSPLFWEQNVIDALIDTVREGLPVAILPEPNAGVSAPYTLAGLLTVNNAECLSGIVMLQLLKAGSKVIYANSWTTTDMRSGAALVGSAETTICRIAAAQLARFYHIPSHTTAPNSDNHAHDEQNAWEKTFSQFCAIAAGHDLIVNCGMFATGMTCSHEQLLMDEEISQMARRIAAGIIVDSETIASQWIKHLGPQNPNYLTTEHTMKWLYSDEYFVPRLAIRGPQAIWQNQGAKETYQVAKEKVRYFKTRPSQNQLTKDVRAKLEKIILEFSDKV